MGILFPNVGSILRIYYGSGFSFTDGGRDLNGTASVFLVKPAVASSKGTIIGSALGLGMTLSVREASRSSSSALRRSTDDGLPPPPLVFPHDTEEFTGLEVPASDSFSQDGFF
jgi:hypothetical protein